MSPDELARCFCDALRWPDERAPLFAGRERKANGARATAAAAAAAAAVAAAAAAAAAPSRERGGARRGQHGSFVLSL